MRTGGAIGASGAFDIFWCSAAPELHGPERHEIHFDVVPATPEWHSCRCRRPVRDKVRLQRVVDVMRQFLNSPAFNISSMLTGDGRGRATG
jgi:hypothetical protein